MEKVMEKVDKKVDDDGQENKKKDKTRQKKEAVVNAVKGKEMPFSTLLVFFRFLFLLLVKKKKVVRDIFEVPRWRTGEF